MKKKTSKKLLLDKIKIAQLSNMHQGAVQAAAPTITRCSAMGCPSILAC
ncbi:hypothetical protein [Chitinophaga japonensis]|uniref:Uncharacterized protein n=1 Tax=Chitinophaga japonensis TaxID=104662 RepID=A0A562TH54_CHIJA|nr:hypothetical protein [Chitinophaga japonensis]TWI92160.1 hypothetical protein LX66_1543 [Chitinophaga japonensis]